MGAGEERGAEAHELGDGAAVARALHDLVGDDGDGLGVVELEAARLAAAGEVGGGDDEEFFAFAGGEMHGGAWPDAGQSPRCWLNLKMFLNDVVGEFGYGAAYGDGTAIHGIKTVGDGAAEIDVLLDEQNRETSGGAEFF